MTFSPLSRSSLYQLLKQRFGGSQTVDLPISAYGKLPIYKDFLRHGLAGAEAQAFKKWLDRGISKFWAAHEACRGHEIGPHALVLTFPATGKQILAYLWGSHDHGALRRFPFALFVSLPVRRSLELLDALDQVVAQASSLRRQLAGLSDLDAFYPLIRTAAVTLTLRDAHKVRERLAGEETPTVGELGASLYRDEAEKQWPALVAYLSCRSADGRSRRPSSTLALRLPASSILPQARWSALWCALLSGARQRGKKPLQVFFAIDEPASGITILHRDLRDDDVFALHPQIPEYEYIEDLRLQVPACGSEAAALDADQKARPVGSLFAE